MPYISETSQYERRATTVIDATPDGETVSVAIDVKLDQGIDDYVSDLNHHNENGNHYPETSVGSDSRFLKQSPAGEVSWANGVVAADAALKDFSNVASGAIVSDKLASVAPAKITQDALNRFVTDAEKAAWNTPMVGALMWATGDAPLPGTIAAQGVLLSRSTYSRLWAYAQASGNLAASDEARTDGQYSPGDGSTTFRIPKIDDRFIRSKSSTRAVGLVEEDAFQQFEATWRLGAGMRVNSASGAGSVTNSTSSGAAIGGNTGNLDLVLDPSTVARTATETRPKAITYLACIVY